MDKNRKNRSPMINEKIEFKKTTTTAKSLVTLFLLSFPNQTNSKRSSAFKLYKDIGC